jgi:hypothetical protein
MEENYHFTIGLYSKFSFNSDFEYAVKKTHDLINTKSHFVITYNGDNNYKKLKELSDSVDSEYLFNNGYQLYGLSCELKKQDEPMFKKYLAKKRIECYESDNRS